MAGYLCAGYATRVCILRGSLSAVELDVQVNDALGRLLYVDRMSVLLSDERHNQASRR